MQRPRIPDRELSLGYTRERMMWVGGRREAPARLDGPIRRSADAHSFSEKTLDRVFPPAVE